MLICTKGGTVFFIYSDSFGTQLDTGTEGAQEVHERGTRGEQEVYERFTYWHYRGHGIFHFDTLRTSLRHRHMH